MLMDTISQSVVRKDHGAKASGHKKGLGLTGGGVVAFTETGEDAYFRSLCERGKFAGAFAYGFVEEGDAVFAAVADGKRPAKVVAGNVQVDELALNAAVSLEHQFIGVPRNQLVPCNGIDLLIHCTRFGRP